MPLTLELYGSNPQKIGHLIIDRNNLIITYPKTNEGSQSREKMANLIYKSFDVKFYANLISDRFLGPDDPRHVALEHMSEYDKGECLHSHAVFNNDINFDIIKLIFSNINNSNDKDLLSTRCINNILEISKEYFSALKTSEPLRESEANYREDKNRAYAKADALVKADKEKQKDQYKDPSDLMTSFFMASLFAPSFLKNLKNMLPTELSSDNKDRKVLRSRSIR